jgi:hypothetical protein
MAKKFDEIFVKLDQIGVIAPIEDCERLTKNMMDVFEMDESVHTSKEMSHKGSVYRGNPVEPGPRVQAEFFNKFDIELEYLCPIDENSSWMEYHKKVDRGIHHIRFDVNNFEDAVEYLHEKGIEVYHIADSPRRPGMKFAYFDSYDKLGFYIEIINFSEFKD